LFSAGAQAVSVARLYGAASAGAVVIDAAGYLATDGPEERVAASILGHAQVKRARRSRHDELTDQIATRKKGCAGFDRYVVGATLTQIFGGIAAARPAGLAVQRHGRR